MERNVFDFRILCRESQYFIENCTCKILSCIYIQFKICGHCTIYLTSIGNIIDVGAIFNLKSL
jgi:hypothetical protein